MKGVRGSSRRDVKTNPVDLEFLSYLAGRLQVRILQSEPSAEYQFSMAAAQ